MQNSNFSSTTTAASNKLILPNHSRVIFGAWKNRMFYQIRKWTKNFSKDQGHKTENFIPKFKYEKEVIFDENLDEGNQAIRKYYK